MFSCKSFMVLALPFKSITNFNLVFAHGVIQYSTFTLLYVVVQLSQHHLLKIFHAFFTFLINVLVL